MKIAQMVNNELHDQYKILSNYKLKTIANACLRFKSDCFKGLEGLKKFFCADCSLIVRLECDKKNL